MKRNRRYIEVIATLLLATLFSASAIPISHAAKKPKSAGRTSNTISNTIIDLNENGPQSLDIQTKAIYDQCKKNQGADIFVSKIDLITLITYNNKLDKNKNLTLLFNLHLYFYIIIHGVYVFFITIFFKI